MSYYRAAKPRVIVGIPRASFDPLLQAAGVYTQYKPVLDFFSIREPYHVALADDGIAPNDAPVILVLDAIAVQIDAGLNEIPRATCMLSVGRDAEMLADGAPDAAAASIVHLIERYLGRFVPARIYEHTTTTAAEGVQDLGDNAEWADEWVVVFDGLTVGPTRRGTPTESTFALHLVHFTAALTWSSSLTAQVAAGTSFTGAFAPGAFIATMTNVAAGYPMSPLGAVAASLAGGEAVYTDFWGYRVPGNGRIPYHTGLKGFLANLATQNNLFNWAAMTRADLGGSACPDVGQPRTNDGAIAALRRIEPIWTTNTAADDRFIWNAIGRVIEDIRAPRLAANSNRAIDRSELLAPAGGASGVYGVAGYLYGMPLSFWLSQQTLRNHPLHPGRGFAADVVGASFGDLAPASFWELLAGRYASNYQLAIAPMANRAVILPFQPLMDRVWQHVYASEIETWDDDAQTPLPLRGVVLVSDRQGITNITVAGNNPAAPGAPTAYQQNDAAYDSCEAGGVFIYRTMPPWLADASRLPGAFAPGTLQNTPRAMAGLPWGTVPAAAAARDQLVAQSPELGLAAAAGLPLGGVAADNLAAPRNVMLSSGYRLARAHYQQERTRPRTVYVRGRFRYDIGPGSIVRLELPADRYVREALVGQRNTYAVGMVLRVTISLDQEGQNASTALQVGFVRTEGETQPGTPLFADSHPFWSCACLGVPWADARWIRDKLGDRASLVTTLSDFISGNL